MQDTRNAEISSDRFAHLAGRAEQSCLRQFESNLSAARPVPVLKLPLHPGSRKKQQSDEHQQFLRVVDVQEFAVDTVLASPSMAWGISPGQEWGLGEASIERQIM